jgi:hypothetical protein
MRFNFGAFAGGLAKGGMETYQMMEAIESQKKRDELIAMQAQEMKAAGEERAALKEAAGVYGKVGGQDYAPELQRTAGIGAQQAQGLAVNTGAGGDDFDRAVNESTQGVLREAAGRQGAALPTDAAMKPTAYTREQADADYLAKVRGISPDRALDVEAKQMQVKAGRREDKFNEEFDAERNKWNQQTSSLMTKFDDALTKDGANGVVREIGPEFKKITGQSISLVGNEIVVGTGKNAEKIPAKDLRGAFESAMSQHYTQGFADSLVKKGMFKNANDAITYQLKRAELGVAERGVAVKEAVAPSEIAKNYGAANMYSNRGAGGSGGGAAGKAAAAQQMVDDGLAPDLTAAYRIMASKDARSSVDQDWAKTRLEIVKANPGATPAELAQQKEAFYAENGVAPAAMVSVITSGVNPQTGKPFAPADADKLIADFNKKYPASKVDKADLTWVKKPNSAIPDKDKTEAKDKAEPKAEAKPKTALPWQEKQKAEAARFKAEREARDIEEERKRKEKDEADKAKVKSALRAGLPT